MSYHLYVTFSLNALDPAPVFHTYRLTTDPVQVGAICPQQRGLQGHRGSNRNLLDFNDLHIDREGRVYIAFADGCTGEMRDQDNAHPEDSRDKLGSVYYLSNGPSLYDAADLTALV